MKNYLGRWETLLNHVFSIFSENSKGAEFTECTKVQRFFLAAEQKWRGRDFFLVSSLFLGRMCEVLAIDFSKK